jgi:hypothetical protein
MRNKLLYLVFAFCAMATAAGAAHPFLLVKESEYAQLRTLAASNPWLVMKNRAIRDATGYIVFDPAEEYGDKCVDGWGIISATSLAYILDDVNKATYKASLVTQMNTILDDLSYRPDPDGYAENVGLKIGPLVDIFSAGGGLAAPSIMGLWALYEGDTTSFESWRQAYMTELDTYTGENGVIRTGPGYGEARFLGSGREVKALFMDVLEYQGYHDFYATEPVKSAHEFIFGYSATPFGRRVPFGDTSPMDTLRENNNAQVWRAYRFGEQAGKYAKWHMGSQWPQGRLTTGLLTLQAVATGELAPSRIFPDGGAFFIENNQSTNALYGAMWNVKGSFSHSHKDTNALALSAYGQQLLCNSGYNGSGNATLGFTWDYIFNFAGSSNTVRVDGVDHAAKCGSYRRVYL